MVEIRKAVKIAEVLNKQDPKTPIERPNKLLVKKLKKGKISIQIDILIVLS